MDDDDAAKAMKKKRSPRKKKDPSSTPCYFHTSTASGCKRGAKCSFVHAPPLEGSSALDGIGGGSGGGGSELGDAGGKGSGSGGSGSGCSFGIAGFVPRQLSRQVKNSGLSFPPASLSSSSSSSRDSRLDQRSTSQAGPEFTQTAEMVDEEEEEVASPGGGGDCSGALGDNDRGDLGISELTGQMKKLRVLPKKLSFGRRGGSRSARLSKT
jgi:hypothetical protein